MANIQTAVEQSALATGNQSMMWGTVLGFFGYLAQINWIGLSGALAAVIGMLIAGFVQLRRNKRETEARLEESRLNAERNRREEELHQIRVALLKKGVEIESANS